MPLDAAVAQGAEVAKSLRVQHMTERDAMAKVDDIEIPSVRRGFGQTNSDHAGYG